MPIVRFITTPKLPRDLVHLGYAMGDEVEMSEDQAGRWLRRGVAEIIPDAEIEELEPEPKEPAADQPTPDPAAQTARRAAAKK